jgi:hypothetical protein
MLLINGAWERLVVRGLIQSEVTSALTAAVERSARILLGRDPENQCS